MMPHNNNKSKKSGADLEDGRIRVVIESVQPEVDAGRFAIKRTVGEQVVVEADAFTDGHDAVICVLRHRKQGAAEWHDVAMAALGNDRWRASFTVTEQGRYEYTVTAWIDPFLSWQRELVRRVQAEDIQSALLTGAAMVEHAAKRSSGADSLQLQHWAEQLRGQDDLTTRRELGLDENLLRSMLLHVDRSFATHYPRTLAVVVDRERARFSAWYEMFPRSCGASAQQHGTFNDCIKRLPYIAAMGFDVLYLPPIHPIGRVKRKGPNNALIASENDPGSPWAIGAAEGGHKAILSDLGSLEDFKQLVAAAQQHGMELALDIAYQCAPDHPYVKEHPEWFRTRPDGTVQYAENPPKKYEDIYPFNFDSARWHALWEELKSVIDYWVAQGVKIFRIDNPHTKPFALWEWIITEVKRTHPDVLFLAEAFTRPRVTHRLAKVGFTQSYNYFPWRNTKPQLTEYLLELTQDEGREYFRPNLWPNTPDILTEYLQFGGRPAFMARLVLAATLGASYGIYGPAFELADNEPREPGSEEYLHSEKYQIRNWDLNRADSLKDFIARINRIRRENPALQQDWNLRFHTINNHELICYSKASPDLSDVIVVVINLDPHHTQSGWVELDLPSLGIDTQRPYQVHDMLSDARYLWHGMRNFVELNPSESPAHIFRLRRQVRTEHDFDYYF